MSGFSYDAFAHAANTSEVFDMVNFKWNQKRALEEVRKIAKDNGLAF
ncbi:hypothetical protein [Mitsuokella multacida]